MNRFILNPHLFVCLLFLTAAVFAQQSAGEATRLEIAKSLERGLKGSENHIYIVALKKGDHVRGVVNRAGVDVFIRLLAPNGAETAKVETGDGPYGPLYFSHKATVDGDHRIEIGALNKQAPIGRYGLKIEEILSAEQHGAYLTEKHRKQQAIIQFLAENSVPIRTVQAGNGFGDLRPFRSALRNVRFAALGESTHGTREFFQFKHRMVEFLVREMGFRVFGIEAGYMACQRINDYVMGVTDNGAEALESQGYWTWDTEEIRALLDWMRAYNLSVPQSERVKFVGFDIQRSDIGRERLLAYLKRVSPERAAEAEEIFRTDVQSIIGDIWSTSPEKRKAGTERLKAIRAKYEQLYIQIDFDETRLVCKSSQAEYDEMRLIAKLMTQEVHASSPGGELLRDLYMADLVNELSKREKPGTKFILWAHNGHIANLDSVLGGHLREIFGKEYYALGFSFGEGEFQAREWTPTTGLARLLKAWTVGPAKEGSMDWYLAQTQGKLLFFDIRAAASGNNKVVADWLASRVPFRNIGGLFESRFEHSFRTYIDPSPKQAFDGMLFIDRTTRARPNPTVKHVAGR